MFLGGSSPQELADTIRPPSIKGALRFWWRALNWRHHYRGGSSAQLRQALNDLHHHEASLFGSASDDHGGGGQSRVLLRSMLSGRRSQNQWPTNGTGSGYLGLGLFETRAAAHRQSYAAGQDFELQLRLRPGTSAADCDSLREALSAWGALGGLGSRGQRRGFGSVALTRVDDQTIAYPNQAAYQAHIDRLITPAETVDLQPPFTAFSAETRCAIISRASEPMAAHTHIGNAFKAYRGVDGSLRGRAKLPFGLPLTGVDNDARRASPLLFHIHPVANDYLGVALFVPATFHPRYTDVDYQVVTDFLDQEARV